VTNYLRERFHQDKIYLMAQSGGSFLLSRRFSVRRVVRCLYWVGHIVHQVKSEKIAYEFMLAEYQARGDTNMVNKLKPLLQRWRCRCRPPTTGCATTPCTCGRGHHP